MSLPPTIFALSSGAGRAGVAVIRISGPRTRLALDTLTGGVPGPRRAALRHVRRPSDDALLDQSLVLWFPGPASFTGEDCAEFHVHGGRAVVAGVLGALGGLEGFRLAEAGEFTRRAFDNGKLDLTAAEGLADLIDAETEAQRAQAIGQVGGGLAVAADVWRAEVIQAMGLVEAAIDFSDEGDVTGPVLARARQLMTGLYQRLRDVLDDGRRGEILRDGFTVVIAGPPNAGKSSLLNAFARRDVAIVSDEPGTTRDVVEARLDVDGLPVILLDTAGVRTAPGKVEQEGIRRALKRAQDADLVLWVTDHADEEVPVPDALTGRHVVRVTNKAEGVATSAAPDGSTYVSALTGEGLDGLLSTIAAFAGRETREAALITRARHRLRITEALDALDRFLTGEQTESELRAEDLRQAAQAIGKLTGRVNPEEVLGEIFGRFCIGK